MLSLTGHLLTPINFSSLFNTYLLNHRIEVNEKNNSRLSPPQLTLLPTNLNRYTICHHSLPHPTQQRTNQNNHLCFPFIVKIDVPKHFLSNFLRRRGCWSPLSTTGAICPLPLLLSQSFLMYQWWCAGTAALTNLGSATPFLLVWISCISNFRLLSSFNHFQALIFLALVPLPLISISSFLHSCIGISRLLLIYYFFFQ